MLSSPPLYACASTSRTTMVRFANGLRIAPTRPRARTSCRLITIALPTWASATTRSSTSRSWLFSALAIADSRHLRTSRAMRLRENSRSASAVATFLPRISAATRLSFCGETRSMRATAFASFSPSRRSRARLLIAGSLASHALGLAVGRVAVEGARRRELAELVADHLLGDQHRNVLLPVVDAERQADELRQNGRPPGPDLDDVVTARLTGGILLLEHIALHERTF